MDDSAKKGNIFAESSQTPMPKDFWQMVQEARSRAKAEIERRRRLIYQSFVTEEVKDGRRVPMPSEFWKAMETDIGSNSSSQFSTENFVKKGLKANIAELESLNGSESFENLEALDYSEELDKNVAQELSLTLVKPANSTTKREDKELSFKEAAMIILKREGRPMTAKEIVSIALSEGLIKTAGKTPDASLAGQIYTDIHRKRDSSLFVIVGPRTYAIKASADQIKAANENREDVNAEGAGTVIQGPAFWHAPREEASNSETSASQEATSENFLQQPQESKSETVCDFAEATHKADLFFQEATLETRSEKVVETDSVIEQAGKEPSEDTDHQESRQKKSNKEEKMGYKQAARYLLEREKRPMTAKEIVNTALSENLIHSDSKTPDATLAGQLYTEMKRFGERCPIKLVGPRTYSLREWDQNEN
ncbi:MAG: winged helix-turn-helix domain-containing protein [Blastocatellia bacterium]|nr:winged helix-turn-helix domain-containing protein [Blastocatellia bacterium]